MPIYTPYQIAAKTKAETPNITFKELRDIADKEFAKGNDATASKMDAITAVLDAQSNAAREKYLLLSEYDELRDMQNVLTDGMTKTALHIGKQCLNQESKRIFKMPLYTLTITHPKRATKTESVMCTDDQEAVARAFDKCKAHAAGTKVQVKMLESNHIYTARQSIIETVGSFITPHLPYS